MHLFSLLTLVDITDTGVTRVAESNTKEYHQQQNLNVLLQTIGLRTQVFEPHVTIYYHTPPITNPTFGSFYHDEDHTCWGLTFMVENPEVWNDGKDHMGLLKDELTGVAITSDLDNTAEFPVNIFDAKDNVNLLFLY